MQVHTEFSAPSRERWAAAYASSGSGAKSNSSDLDALEGSAMSSVESLSSNDPRVLEEVARAMQAAADRANSAVVQVHPTPLSSKFSDLE